ncbi:hypothetical protein SSX86_000745 [Deinandra increscens subsp. villosa]|uniref:Cupin type-1 domain-containing protein n=1 Tax=Deinandra increscens subsp. villosa TaxID=3103831 RepID=A0AAP0DPZ9_9ASTR
MAKKSSTKWLFFVLAVVVLTTTLVAGAYDKDRRSSKVFPPEEDYGRDRSPGGYQDYGRDRGRDYGRDQDYGRDRDRGGREEGRGRVFPPEEDYGRGGRGRGGGGEEDEGRGRVFPPEGEGDRDRGRGGRDFRPDEEERGGRGRRGWTEERRFILSDMKRVVATDAGGMRVVKGVGGRFTQSPMHIGFITMEPDSMFIPQYLDSSLILFVEIGEARIGSIYNDQLVEKDLKAGDLYRIEAGSAFYMVNTAQGQRLQIIASIDTAESTGLSSFEPFFIGGGTNPRSVLAGFDTHTLATAFNVSHDAIDELLSSRQEGAIVFLNPDGGDQPRDEPSMWKRFLELGPHERKMQMKGIVDGGRKPTDDDEAETSVWFSLRKLVVDYFGTNKDSDKSLDSYNIYNDEADFRNDYGWSVEVDGDDYDQLKLSDFAVYLVNLTAGSMMAPHINPTATEYGVVLSGSGNIQVVFPNGTLAMDAEVSEGDVFWIPRYFPFCQVASRSSPFVFFGFSTSARNNRPQFLAGKGSVLQTMMGPGFAASFGMSEDRMAEIVNAQSQTTILPSTSASPGGGGEEIPQGEAEGDPAKGGEGEAGGDPAKGGESAAEDKRDPAQGEAAAKDKHDPARGGEEKGPKIRMPVGVN